MKHKHTSGFTIVELIVVIVVLAILATLVLSGFSGIQAKGRDRERLTDAKTVGRLLEAYYIDNGAYPAYSSSGTGISVAAWRTTNLPNFRSDHLTPPGLSSVTLVNSATPTTSQYGYASVGTCTGNRCPSYRLYWRSEETNTINTLTSLN